MVLIRSLDRGDFLNIGFSSKISALYFIKTNKFKSKRNESKDELLLRLSLIKSNYDMDLQIKDIIDNNINVNIINVNPFKKSDLNILTFIRRLFCSNKGKTVRFIYKIGSTIIIDTIKNIPDIRFTQFWSSFYFILMYDSDTSYFDEHQYGGDLIFYVMSDIVVSSPVNQSYLDSKFDHCLLSPIKNWAMTTLDECKSASSRKKYKSIINKIEKYSVEYENGIPEDCIKKISDDLNISIRISFPIKSKIYDNYYVNDRLRPLKTFKYINTRMNHLDIDTSKVISECSVITLGQEQLIDLKLLLEKEKEFFYYRYNYKNISKIYHNNEIYQLNTDYYDKSRLFELKYNIRDCFFDSNSHSNRDLYWFVRYSLHINGTKDFKSLVYKNDSLKSKLNHIDMEKAYVNFNKCKYYRGFLGKITDFRLTNKIEGNGLYLISGLKFTNDKFSSINNSLGNIYRSNNIYTNVELDMLSFYGCIFSIDMGCWGSKDFYFEFTDDMISGVDEYGVKYYCKWSGSLCMDNEFDNYWMVGDLDYFRNIKNFYGDDINIKYNKTEGMLSFIKKVQMYGCHILSFITSYQRIQVIDQIYLMDINKIYRVCVDGIYYEDHDFDIIGCFRKKDDIKLGNMESGIYCTNIDDHQFYGCGDNIDKHQFYGCGDNREHYPKELFIGAGGNGKTHYNLKDRGLVNVLYCSPSWKLANNKKDEYKCNVDVWHNVLNENKLIRDKIKSRYNVIIFDEVSMMTNGQKQFIFDEYSSHKIIMCGDIGYQLGPFYDKNYDVNVFKLNFDNIIEFKVNYRFKCDKLKKLCNDVRYMIQSDYSSDEINLFVINVFSENNLLIDVGYLINNYKINDYILVSKIRCKLHKKNDCNCDGMNLVKKYCDLFTGKFSDEKYYINVKNPDYPRGTILIQNSIPKYSEIRHAFTIHSVQGETISEDNNIYIDSNCLFNENILYTALSRAKTLDMIKIII